MWTDRYPEIAFLLSFSAYDTTPKHRIDSEEECALWYQGLLLEGVDILYVFGIGSGESYSKAKSWLQEKKERMLIFLEDDLGVLSTLISQELLNDPQVHIQLISDSKELDATLQTLVETFPSNRIEVSASIHYAKMRFRLFKKLNLKLLRLSAVTNALMTEALYSHELLVNVLANLKHWPQSFFANGLKGKFKNIPAIICGAGPSLNAAIPLLRTLEDKALIIAGGSAIAALSHFGLVPHIGMALDPNREEYSRLKASSAFEMPLLYGTRLHPDVFQTCSGPFGYIQSFTGGPCEAYFERELGIQADPIGPDLGPEALSITTLAIALAVEMGCNPIILNGVDLAYTGMQRYAEGVMQTSQVFLQKLAQERQAAERLLRRKGIEGTMVHTLVKWVMESSTISNYAHAHPQTQFINTSCHGLGFKAIPNEALESVIEMHCQNTFDLRGWVHAEICQLKLVHLTRENIQAKMDEVRASLQRLHRLSKEMLEELNALKTEERSFPTGKMTLLQLDFEEEKAFECFLPHVGPMLDRLLNRSFPDLEGRSHGIERQMAKWERLHQMIQKELLLIS